MFVRRNILRFFFTLFEKLENVSGKYASLCTENCNRLTRLVVVFLSKLSENLVNFYFTRQGLKLRISNVIMLKFSELDRRFEKCFCKTDSLTLAKLQQVSVSWNGSSEKSVGNFVKSEFSLKNFSGKYASLCTGNMNRLSGLLVVCLSKVSENLVNFYFLRQWLILRISDVIMLKFFELNRRFEKCFGKTDSSTWAKPQQVSVRGKRSSEESVGNFVKFGFSLKTSENMFVRRNILSFFFPNLKNWKMFRENMHLFVQKTWTDWQDFW